jgi:hypothetical protein
MLDSVNRATFSSRGGDVRGSGVPGGGLVPHGLRDSDGELVCARQGGTRSAAFRTISADGYLVRVLSGYALFTITELAVWVAMLVCA